MKILHILEPLSYGGVEKMVLNLIKSHSSEGNDISVALPQSMENGIVEGFYQYATVYKLEYKNSYNIPSACRSISNLIKKIKPDIIHTHARRPMVYTSIVNRNIPHLRTYHMEENERIPKLFIEKKLIEKRINGWAVTWEGIIEKDLKKINKIGKPIQVIYNGVDAIEVKKNEIDHELLRLLIVGRLFQQKGIDIIIDALALLSNNYKNKVRLNIVGEGILKDKLIEKSKSLGLEKIILFEGFHTDLKPYYKEADIFVMPSRYEGLPLSFIESMSSSTPVASSTVGAMPTIIKDGENGWLISPNTPETWKNFIENILEIGIPKNIGEAAQETYNKHFKVDVMSKKYYELYIKLVEKV